MAGSSHLRAGIMFHLNAKDLFMWDFLAVVTVVVVLVEVGVVVDVHVVVVVVPLHSSHFQF